MEEKEVQEFLENLKAMRGLMRNLVRLQRKMPNSGSITAELMRISEAITRIEELLEPVGKALRG